MRILAALTAALVAAFVPMDPAISQTSVSIPKISRSLEPASATQPASTTDNDRRPSPFAWLRRNLSEPDTSTDQSIAVYGGQAIRGTFLSAQVRPFFANDFDDQSLITVAGSQRLLTIADRLGIEVEAAAGRRFGEIPAWEFHVALGFRWDRFPWSAAVPTSLAFIGPGLSYSTARLGGGPSGGSNWLNYLATEVTIGLRHGGRVTELLARFHHRSGGDLPLFKDVGGESNFLTVGLRTRF